LIFPLKTDIFVCENRGQRVAPKKIKTRSHKAALARVLSPDKASTSSVSREVNPLSSSVDMEADAMGWMIGGGGDNSQLTFNYGSDPDAGSPRPDVFCQEIPVDIRRLESTPPVVQSDNDSAEAPDPFKEEDDEERFVPIEQPPPKEKQEEENIV
jgi:hypothetical protein